MNHSPDAITDGRGAITILAINYYPENTGCAVYNTGMAEYLAARGYNVEVVTAFPYYPFGADFSAWYEKTHWPKLFLTETLNKVAIRRTNLYKPKRQLGTFSRLLHEISFCLAAGLRLFFSPLKSQIIICVSPPLLLGFTALLAARIKGITYILHLQDLEIELAATTGFIKNQRLIAILSKMEKFLLSRASVVSVISDGMKSVLVGKGFLPEKIVPFYNWAESEYSAAPAQTYSAERFKKPGKFLVFHGGNLGEKQDMKTLLETAELLNEDESVWWLIIGQGSRRKYVEEFVQKKSLQHTVLMDPQPEQKFRNMLASADAVIISQLANITEEVMPSKFLNAAAAAKPVILSVNPACEIARLAEHFGFGLVVEPNSPKKLRQAVKDLQGNPAIARRMGEAAKIFIEKYRNKQNILQNFESELQVFINRI